VTERLTDGVLTSLAGAAMTDGAHETVTYARPRTLLALIAEVREHRAAKLTDEDRDGLEWAKACVTSDDEPMTPLSRSAIAVLDRLLSAPTRKDG